MGTDLTRAARPFIFAASPLQACDTVTLMLFHDSVHMATQGTAEKIVPFGPPPRVEEVLSHAGAKVLVCQPCAVVRYLTDANLDKRITMAGMNEFHAAAARENARVVCF